MPYHCTLAASCCTPLAVACANVRVHVYRTCESASTDCVACAWRTIACICLYSLSLCIQLCVLVRVRDGMCDVYICLLALCVVCVIAQTRACKSRSVPSLRCAPTTTHLQRHRLADAALARGRAGGGEGAGGGVAADVGDPDTTTHDKTATRRVAARAAASNHQMHRQDAQRSHITCVCCGARVCDSVCIMRMCACVCHSLRYTCSLLPVSPGRLLPHGRCSVSTALAPPYLESPYSTCSR